MSMESKLSSVAKTTTPSPIQELSHLAQRCNAINLAEGFPDFPAPPHIKNAAISAINSDFNQYRHVQGICDNLANLMKEMHGLDVDPLTDIAICCGQSEAFAAAVFAIINPGDEVLLFDPAYETYEGCIRMAGGVPVYVALDPPCWTLDADKFMKSFTSSTKAVILNSPHNPTGKVFSKDELEIIAGACCTKDCLAITDEVYEHITFDSEKHISLASLPGMTNRTIITSSLSKTYGVTGWRVGWAIAPAFIASAIRNIHTKITDSAPAPFQEAALIALRSPPDYFESLKKEYELKRNYIVNLLAGVGFRIQFKPQGSFFLFAELPEDCLLSDVEYVKELIRQAGVVAVPGCGFFHSNLPSEELSKPCSSYQKRYIRFAFCKSHATLAAAAKKLVKLLDASGYLKLH
ncbi:Aminotran_1_2 domain-containing protein [Cephalotus follicularis]|uniref:Aminotran_1_2 domain-containing protein n=1 Tax=Cephalotus follicularis TaxID=3775 RepID=A0A1Q3AN95_CEPFO|nr:Aminotran_1_2 domain-containing protein [Cephalotus follicularis]